MENGTKVINGSVNGLTDVACKRRIHVNWWISEIHLSDMLLCSREISLWEGWGSSDYILYVSIATHSYIHPETYMLYIHMCVYVCTSYVHYCQVLGGQGAVHTYMPTWPHLERIALVDLPLLWRVSVTPVLDGNPRLVPGNQPGGEIEWGNGATTRMSSGTTGCFWANLRLGAWAGRPSPLVCEKCTHHRRLHTVR